MKKSTFKYGLEGLLMVLDARVDVMSAKDRADEIMTYIERCKLQAPKIKVVFDLTKPDGSIQKSCSHISRWED